MSNDRYFNLNQPMDKDVKEYYVTKLEKYYETDKTLQKMIAYTAVTVLGATVLVSLMISGIISILEEPTILKFIGTFLAGIVGTPLALHSISMLITTISTITGIDIQTEKIEEWLEIYALKHPEDAADIQNLLDNNVEKGRSR